MEWGRYIVRGIIFAAVFTLVGALVFSLPMPNVLYSGIFAGALWVVIGHYAGIFKKADRTK